MPDLPMRLRQDGLAVVWAPSSATLMSPSATGTLLARSAPQQLTGHALG
jgi:hypothetical protein